MQGFDRSQLRVSPVQSSKSTKHQVLAT